MDSLNENLITLVSPYPVTVNGPEFISRGPNVQPQLREIAEESFGAAIVSAILEGVASKVVVSCSFGPVGAQELVLVPMAAAIVAKRAKRITFFIVF